jgi:transcriptional regulator with XRE-family HTH domain
MSGRSVQPDGEKIRKLRHGHGWTVDQLRRKAGCVERSIQNAENGRPIQVGTLAVIAGALKVEPRELILDQQVQPTSTFRLQLLIETDIEKLNNSPQLHSLIELLTKMLSAMGEITIKELKAGSIIVTLAMTEVDALRLIALFPDFHEHAREVIREKVEYSKSQTPDYQERLREAIYRKPDGKYYISTSTTNAEANYLAYLSDMLVLGDGVKELRMTAGPDEGAGSRPQDSEPPAPGPLRQEMEIHPDILAMAGFPMDDDSQPAQGLTFGSPDAPG